MCSLRCLRVLPGASLRTPCALLLALLDTTSPAHQRVGTPAPDLLLRPCARRLRHADERDPHARPRRPCSHLRGARSDQDDQPARQAGQSHAGAHNGHPHTRAACSTTNCALPHSSVTSARAPVPEAARTLHLLIGCKPDLRCKRATPSHKPDLRCKPDLGYTPNLPCATCPAGPTCALHAPALHGHAARPRAPHTRTPHPPPHVHRARPREVHPLCCPAVLVVGGGREARPEQAASREARPEPAGSLFLTEASPSAFSGALLIPLGTSHRMWSAPHRWFAPVCSSGSPPSACWSASAPLPRPRLLSLIF